jgi:hypothetical protein
MGFFQHLSLAGRGVSMEGGVLPDMTPIEAPWGHSCGADTIVLDWLHARASRAS